MRIIAIEEHCILPQQRKQLDTSWFPENQRRQVDATMDERLAAMDAAGIDLQVLSVPAPQPRVLPAEIVVPIDIPEGTNIYRPTSTRIAYIATVDILASLVAYAIQPKATVTLRRIKQQLITHRDGDDDKQLLGD